MILVLLVTVAAVTSAQEIDDYRGRWFDEPMGMLPQPINHLDIADHETFYSVGVYEGMGEETAEGIELYGVFSGWGVITWRRDDDGNLQGGSAVIDHLDHDMHHYIWMTLDGDHLRVTHQKFFGSEQARETYHNEVQFFGHYETWEEQWMERVSTDTGADGAFDW